MRRCDQSSAMAGMSSRRSRCPVGAGSTTMRANRPSASVSPRIDSANSSSMPGGASGEQIADDGAIVLDVDAAADERLEQRVDSALIFVAHARERRPTRPSGARRGPELRARCARRPACAQSASAAPRASAIDGGRVGGDEQRCMPVSRPRRRSRARRRRCSCRRRPCRRRWSERARDPLSSARRCRYGRPTAVRPVGRRARPTVVALARSVAAAADNPVWRNRRARNSIGGDTRFYHGDAPRSLRRSR